MVKYIPLDAAVAEIKSYISNHKETIAKLAVEQADALIEAIKEEKVDNANKVKPSFNVGDWVIFNNNYNKDSIYRIEKAENYQYTLKHILGGSMPLSYSSENMLRLWTITDAKDGDVLVASDGSIFLFAGVVDCACEYYVALTADNYVKINKEGGYWETSRAAYPATKEQRDLLFQKMKESGYTWDSKKKEPIRI